MTLRAATAFGAASGLAAFPVGVGTPIAVRALTGVVGATTMPSAVSPVSALFRDAPRRTVTVSARGSGSPAGTALAPATGGAPLEHPWRGPVFLLPPPPRRSRWCSGRRCRQRTTARRRAASARPARARRRARRPPSPTAWRRARFDAVEPDPAAVFAGDAVPTRTGPGTGSGDPPAERADASPASRPSPPGRAREAGQDVQGGPGQIAL
ncbi:hypothetical protein H7K43_10195 [Streptomyces sp. TYQ1024]|nr:hypothetical protein [Streptomyces sp. TYQ1024]